MQLVIFLNSNSNWTFFAILDLNQEGVNKPLKTFGVYYKKGCPRPFPFFTLNCYQIDQNYSKNLQRYGNTERRALETFTMIWDSFGVFRQ